MAEGVMLAVTAKIPPEAAIPQLMAVGNWWFEIKYDGIRAVLSVRDGEVEITNRRGRDITFRYPDVVAAWAELGLAGLTGTLDGEIVCLDGQGNPDFSRIHRRDAQERSGPATRLSMTYPATFIAFDALELGGGDLRALTYLERREALQAHLPAASVSFASQDGAVLWQVVQERGLEGLMAKLDRSTYTPGRSPSWVKLRATKRGSVLVGGYTPGKGSRGEIGALVIYLWDPEATPPGLVQVGSVGSGITDADMRILMQRIDSGDPIVIDVEYLQRSPDGRLRMPVFRGIRTDISPTSCLVGSLP